MFTSIIKSLALCAGAITLPAVLVPSEAGGGNLERNRYIGAQACKNCHKAKSKGEQYTKWENVEDGHSQAWKVLATAAAKKAGAKVGVSEPQKDAKCLKCHVTAYGEKKTMIKRGFKQELGVQCESCHGPGEKHAQARFKAAASGDADPEAYVKIPDDEIIRRPTEKTCVKCHNDESPSFKPFCFKMRRAKISHRDPRVKRTAEEDKALECQCGGEDKCKCTQCECGGFETPAGGKPPKEGKDGAKKSSGK